MFQTGLLNVMEYIGVISFAIIGAYVAMQRKMDVLGIFVLAYATACGGGILRDTVMNTGIPVFFSSYVTIILVFVSVIFVLCIRRMIKIHFIIVIFDAVGLSVFAIDAGMKAIEAGYNFPQFIFASVITACGGGVIRDILAQRVPTIFRHDIYALAAAAGAIFLWFAYPWLGSSISMYISLALVFIVRMVCVYYNVNLPILHVGERK